MVCCNAKWAARGRARKYAIEGNSLRMDMQSSRSIIRKQSVGGSPIMSEV